MALSNQQAREKSLWTLYWRACPELELLEDRAPPSNFPINRLLAFPVEGPVAAFQEVARNTERNLVLLTPELTRAEVPPVAGPGAANELALNASLLAGLSDSRLSDLAPSATSVETAARQSVSQNLPTQGIDLLAAAGLNGWGSPERGRDTLHDTQGLTDGPPEITKFRAVDNCDGTWTLEGHVASSFVGALAVDFGGSLPSVNGQTTAVQTDGSFEMTVRPQPNEQGIVTAQAIDPQGQGSNIAEAPIQQPGCGSQSAR